MEEIASWDALKTQYMIKRTEMQNRLLDIEKLRLKIAAEGMASKRPRQMMPAHQRVSQSMSQTQSQESVMASNKWMGSNDIIQEEIDVNLQNQILISVLFMNFILQVGLAKVARLYATCRAGNEDPIWDEEYMYALAKIELREIGKKIGDEDMIEFDDWYYNKTDTKTVSRLKRGRMSKKAMKGGREILKNKLTSQLDNKVSRLVGIVNF